jgi:putative oxidoreductase
LQRLFSTFADGFPGGGILLLRLVAGVALIYRGIAAMSAGAHIGVVVPQVVGAVAGLLMLGGLWTPVVGMLAGMVEAWIAFTQPGTQSMAIMLVGLGISLAMIGPGAWSIDAQRYGRKQILPPEPERRPSRCRAG